MTQVVQGRTAAYRWRRDAVWRNLQRSWGAVQSILGYLAMLATLGSGLVLILKRKFSEAALKYMADISEIFSELRQQAHLVVETWNAVVVEPILNVLQQVAPFTIPIAALEAATLILFAMGPVARATWASRAFESAIEKRFQRREELLAALAQQESELKKDQDARAELQKALESKDWSRVKSAFGMVGSLAAGALGATNANSWGQAARNISLAWRSLQKSYGSWEGIEAGIRRLGQTIDAKAAEIRRIDQRITELEAEDKGLLARIGDAERDIVDREVRLYVAREMRTTIALSRISLFIVGAVLAAFAVDWLWAR